MVARTLASVAAGAGERELPAPFLSALLRASDPCYGKREERSGGMAHWLVKSEPDKWSWSDMVAAGKTGTHWNGVRNHVAKNHLKAMRIGEQAFFYHSNEGKEIVGIVEVTRLYHPDPSDASDRFGMVDFRAVKPLPRPVGLATVKTDPDLADMVLGRNSRLSVQPVTEAEWLTVCAMGGLPKE